MTLDEIVSDYIREYRDDARASTAGLSTEM
jgi:hypothetical protein